MHVALVDYRAGNLTSVRKALTACGAEVFSPGSPRDLEASDAVVVPGVGHFGATQILDDSWRVALLALIAAGRPFLGICLGLQWLFEGSDEEPDLPGLAMFPGHCALIGAGRLDRAADVPPPTSTVDAETGARLVKVPHVGWNSLEIVRPALLLAGVPDGAQGYFTHSYAAPVTDVTAATTAHGEVFASVVEREGVFGVQFHPEKSGEVGLRILTNFLAVGR